MGMSKIRIATVLLAGLLLGVGGASGDQRVALSISETITPTEISVGEEATVTLELKAPMEEPPMVTDLILVVDRSESFELEQAISAANCIIASLDPARDRVGLVSFAGEARLDAPLTPVAEADTVREALAKLAAEGKTALGEGIAVATDELDFQGRRPEAMLIEVLLTDGWWTTGREPLEAAQRAAELGIVIHAIAIGRYVNQKLLAQLTEMTGGELFSSCNQTVTEEILQGTRPPEEPFATDIEIVETLTSDIRFVGALENPPAGIIYNNPDGTTELSWRVDSLKPGEGWKTRYTITADRAGIFPLHHDHRERSYVRFTDSQGRQRQEELPYLEIRVVPSPPRPRGCVAAFRIEPESPTTLDDIRFIDESTAEQGEIVAWLWDFGDGTRATEQHPTHRYMADGTYQVKLTVRITEGDECSTKREVTVFTPAITARRIIDTFIPFDQTIPGQSFRVTIEIRANVTIKGLGLDEDIPDGWEFKAIEDDSAQFRKEDLQWIFDEVLAPGTTKTIIYEVTVPEGTAAGKYWIYGTIGSALPQFSKNVDGDKQIEILTGFPIPVVIAHWDVSKNTLDLAGFPAHTIDDRQIEQAREWWREGIEVPFTEDENGKKQVIDLEMMQQLEAYWLTGTSVFEPLPQEEAADAP